MSRVSVPSKYKLGRGERHGPHVLRDRHAASIDAHNTTVGFVPTGNQTQYTFLKSKPSTGENVLGPSSRPVVNALNRQMREKLARASDVIGTTRKQITTNQHSNSGTSVPTGSNFGYTSDYHRLVGGSNGPYAALSGWSDSLIPSNPQTVATIVLGGLVFYLLFIKK